MKLFLRPRAVPILLEEMKPSIIINKHCHANSPELEPALQDGLTDCRQCDVVVILKY